MKDTGSPRPVEVPGPFGNSLTMETLPPIETSRWVMRRKAEVIAAVRGGLLTLVEACQRYSLSVEEYESWERLIDKHGIKALRATKIQNYRTAETAAIGDEPGPA